MGDATDPGTPPSERGEPIGGDIGPYRLLDTSRRRRAGIVYLAIAAVCAAIVMAIDVPAMWFTGVGALLILAAYQFAGAWTMRVTDMEAIEIASGTSSFAVGHGSATLGYRGVLAKPIWQVLVFSDTPSPDRQALVTVDALTGDVTGKYEEAVPAP